jgi:hypothetical protein
MRTVVDSGNRSCCLSFAVLLQRCICHECPKDLRYDMAHLLCTSIRNIQCCCFCVTLNTKLISDKIHTWASFRYLNTGKVLVGFRENDSRCLNMSSGLKSTPRRDLPRRRLSTMAITTNTSSKIMPPMTPPTMPRVLELWRDTADAALGDGELRCGAKMLAYCYTSFQVGKRVR